MYDILELNKKLLAELREIAKELKIKRVESLRKQDLIYKILDQQAISATETKPTKPKAKPKAGSGMTVLDSVHDAIKRARKGITIAKLKEKTKLDARQLSNALYKLSKKNKIQAISRGLYAKK